MKNQKEFNQWLRRAEKIAGESLKIMEGKKYIRIVKETYAFCFIDKETGNVLKAATWKAPAKGARGNIFQSGKEGVSKYGGLYNYR